MDQATFESRATAMARARGHLTAATLARELGMGTAEAKRRLQAMYDGGALELDLDGEALVYRLKGEARPLLPERGGDEAEQDEAGEEPVLSRRPPESGDRRKARKVAAAPAEDEEDSDDKEGVAEGLKEATAAMVARSKTAITQAAVGALLDDVGAAEVASDDKKSMLWGIGLGLFLPGIGLFYAAPIVTASIASAVVLLTVGLLQLIPVIGPLLSYFLFGFFMLTSGVLGGAYTYYFNKTGRRTRLRKGGKGLRALPF